LQEIFYFKPQTIYVSVVFLTVLAYILGEAMAIIIPRKGAIGRFLNPGPFNLKEHAAITLMASAATQSALATEALAAQDLFYGGYPSKAAGVFIVITSQLIGYGLAGLLREVLVYPSHMLWPMNIPVSSLLETLHRDKTETKARLKFFYIVFFVMLVWEIFPEVCFRYPLWVSRQSRFTTNICSITVHISRPRGRVDFLPCTSGQSRVYQSVWWSVWKRGSWFPYVPQTPR
jgi:hypothetical protein